MPRHALIPKTYPFSDPSTRTFSLGVEAGGSVWMSGCTAGRLDAASGRMVVEGNLVEQARIALEKTRLVLEAGGFGMGDIVTMTQYLTPSALAERPALLAFYGEVFGDSLPVVSTIVVKSLLRGAALIEIESVAGRGRSGDLEYLPAATGVDLAAARMRASDLLGERGLQWSNVIRSTELLTPSMLAGNEALPSAPRPSLQVVMPRTVDPDAAVQIQLTASRTGGREVVILSAEGDPGVGGVEAQCREIYARIGRQLEAAGSSLDAVVKTTEFVTPAGLAAYRRTADVRREVFSAPFPAATGVICERLVDPEAQLAVDVIAVIGST